ncbi:MAG: bifunctional 5,10-methylenetetrahydrofolate dehydrogenase/5,10-methenyltetrahydrofolate cyclohydrolase [Puniceicoccaceae bacterium]
MIDGSKEGSKILDGNFFASKILDELKVAVASLEGRPPRVAFIRVGDDPASVSYVKKKQTTARGIGVESDLHLLDKGVKEEHLLQLIDRLNQDPLIDGILVQSPLPKTIGEQTVFNRILPAKDVDGFSQINIGKLVQEDRTGMVACTPLGIIELLRRADLSTRGKHVVVVGRSLIVGKPLALLLTGRGEVGDATVTVCHSLTKDLASMTRQADILIAAVGRPEMIKGDMVKEGAVVIDVGINRIEDPTRAKGYRLVGDVDFEGVLPKASAITPVPGGVGPLTVAMLMMNTLKSRQNSV